MLHPAQERSPARVVDAFREMAVALHVAYLQVLEGNQVARRDKRASPVCGQNPRAAVVLGDTPSPELFWLSFGSVISSACETGGDGAA